MLSVEKYLALVEKARGGEKKLNVAEMRNLLLPPDDDCEKALFGAAREVKLYYVGNYVNLRGLIELSNICTKDCLYCGIRKSNKFVNRYTLSDDEVIEAAALAGKFGYGSVVLQSGERSDAAFAERIEKLLYRIGELPYDLGVTLSLGEQSLETYRRWRRAGAKRYLLRIESSNPELFRKIHSEESCFRARTAALRRLKKADFQVGTGVMIGLPFQSVDDLARDVKFFRDSDCDMIGMGPFIPQKDTPLGQQFPDGEGDAEKRLQMSLRMIALCRLVLRDVNIAATTALQAIDPANGRERGLLAGANVIMPNVGGVEHRKDYQLYNGKPALDENAEAVRNQLIKSLAAIGEYPRLNEHGDPQHYFRRIAAKVPGKAK